MALDIDNLINAVASYCVRTGHFEAVNQHEPKNPPGTGLTAAVWVQSVAPAGGGLATTNALVVLQVRIYASALMEPPDMIDPAVTKACDAIMTALTGDFDLSGVTGTAPVNLRNVDIRGQRGVPMSAEAGWLVLGEKAARIMTITVALIINDAWEEAR